MNCIQRAWRCVVRKPARTILLLLVIVTVSLFFLCGLACRNVNVQTQDITRQAVGAGMRLDINEVNRSKRLVDLSNQIGDGVEGSYGGVHQKKLEGAYGTQWQVWTDNAFDSLKLADIKKIAAVSGIADYNLSTCITPVHPVNFNRIEDPHTDQYNDLGGVSLIGNRKLELDFNVLSGNVTLINGRMIDADDNNVCVISEQLAERNALVIGDTLQLNDYHNADNAQIYEAKIVGIYQSKRFMTPLMAGDTFRSENVIFTDLHFPEKVEGNENDPCFEHAYFSVADVDEYDTVKTAVEALDIAWERYDLIDRNGNMSTMSANFNDLEKISILLIIITFVAGFTILLLIFVFWTKNRNYEIGILLSLGYKKSSILGQLFLEALIIALLSFLIAFAFAPVVSGAAANYLVAEQVEQAEIQKDLNADKVAGNYQSEDQRVIGVNVDITNNMLFFCATNIVILLSVSVGISGISILKKKPRDIFAALS
ncbi:ABC transporter permease [Sinanaerobacter sp. ZZT-01]|uniref:ABC transporter permease n=1 Tax=Sinanaerobacter sp. ZZT-01 TaxID=3111540 RepID=UPI002D76D387|nr:ABC transporter permease [Sinanaerobacter sp. ZZT-01]WRR92349.1 ABC transporter permease [Sinanaerobacter sp. ZZT-01]